ncbi:ATP-binding protein [Salinimicrobium sp. 3283s]|uniref:HD domain-containing protein n=1 Tax=Salinimicrobium sp. 3283s TaxID=3114359 RepID=UPI0031E7C49A
MNTAPLFQKSFDPKIWKYADKIEALKTEIYNIENVVEGYLENISSDFPDLTDHSITHSKMLWRYAEIIIGKKEKYLNPLEAFVLHTVFLIHDAGMCYSILNNKEEIKQDPIYNDYVSQNSTVKEIEKEALFFTVRQRHGNYALRIATEKLRKGDYLISNTQIREELGLFIGKIAKSHTQNVDYIEREFIVDYSTPNFPAEWKIDCQKLAFVLRTSDAAHIDNLRTPKSIKMISEMKGISAIHWTFQKKLGFPIISKEELLTYTTNSPFTAKEQKAWWFCYNALEVLDQELKNANAYFSMNGKDGFSAKGVKSINDTLELGKKYIRTENWNSLDTQVKVSNPINIASELGGIRLYNDQSIALRELIQNSLDAINLHRIYTGQDNLDVGEIKIRILKKDSKFFLAVTDNGIGMSQTIMVNDLLDFGGSYWKSNRFNYDYEGMRSKGFNSIGKFGIGFFSLFMLGSKVTVTSWKFSEDINKMKTLDFYDGLFSNPILRNPIETEKKMVINQGTSVMVELQQNPYCKTGFIGKNEFTENTLYTLCKYFIPFPNVKITTQEVDGEKKVISPYNHNFSFKEIINYLYFPKKGFRGSTVETLGKLKLKLIEIEDDKKKYGKLSLLPYSEASLPFGVIISNGIRIQEINNLCGYVITEDVVTIKRDKVAQLVPFSAMKKWAGKQKKLIEELKLESFFGKSYYSLLLAFDFYQDNMPILLKKIENQYFYVSVTELKIYLQQNSTLSIYHEPLSRKISTDSCPGFLNFPLNFPATMVVNEEDRNRLFSDHTYIERVIQTFWTNLAISEGPCH